MHIGLLHLQRSAECLARPKDRHVRVNVLCTGAGPSPSLVSLKPPSHTGATPLAHLSVFSSLVKCQVKYLGCGQERPNLQKVHFVAPVRFLRVGNASAGEGELNMAAFENFGVAYGVIAEMDGLDRATTLDGKTMYCSSLPETTYEKFLNSRCKWVPNPVRGVTWFSLIYIIMPNGLKNSCLWS